MTVTIVLAEDNPGHVKLIEKNLSRSSFSGAVMKIADGQQLLEFVNSLETVAYLATVIILDLNMPIINGFKVLERLKNDRVTRVIPIIVMTTTDDPNELRRCYDLGANWCVTKPVEYQQFTKVIQEIGDFVSIISL